MHLLYENGSEVHLLDTRDWICYGLISKQADIRLCEMQQVWRAAEHYISGQE